MQPNWSIGPEHVEHLGGGQVGQLDLRPPAGHGDGHAAAAVQGHDDRQRELAMFAPQFHRHRHDRFQRALVVSAGAVRIAAAGEHQSAAALRNPGGEVLHAHVRPIRLAGVFSKNDGRIAGQFLQRPVALRRRPRFDLEPALAKQRGKPEVPAGADAQHRPRAAHAHQQPRAVVLGHRIGPFALERAAYTRRRRARRPCRGTASGWCPTARPACPGQ